MHQPHDLANRTPTEDLDPHYFRFLQRHVHSQSGIVLEDDKKYLVLARLAPLARQLGLVSLNDLCALLMATLRADLSRQVVEAMTTNETYFFRDPAQYEAIRTELLPRLRRERSDSRRLRFWSAAASTGQEAYSLAMLLLEEGFGDWNVEILATDICSRVLERARQAVYDQIEINRGLPSRFLVKYFRRVGLQWRLAEEVVRMVRFERHDLRWPLAGFRSFDLIFCRNILIYFDAETKRRILQQMLGALVGQGWLLLGGAETAFGVEDWFQRHTVGGAAIYVAR